MPAAKNHLKNPPGYAIIGAGKPARALVKTLNVSVIVKEEKKLTEFKKITEFPRGTIYDILQDAYSFDQRNKEIWDENWKETDDFFYDNPDIAEKCGLVTCLDSEPIGFVTWDPRTNT